MDPIELTISDGEETYVIRAERIGVERRWHPGLSQQLDEDTRVETWPLCVAAVAEAGPYPTPYACLEALFKAVVTELFGVRA